MCAEAGATSRPDYPNLDVHPEVRGLFDAVDTDHSGKINSEELQAALINSQGKKFSSEICRLMISMFDSDKSGTIDILEFHHLYTYISQWANIFRRHDKNRSGYIEEKELLQALNQMGYRLTPNFVNIFIGYITKGNQRKKLNFDEFILGCVKIQRLTSAFSERDADLKGVITISYENFIQLLLDDFM